MVSSVPQLRIRRVNDRPLRADGAYVLYWMIAQRRPHYNFALQYAADWAVELRKPLVVFEALRAGYPYASERLHRFVLDGMAANAAAFHSSAASYLSYVEPAPDGGKGLLAALAQRAAIVITDTFPCFFLPTMVRVAGERLGTRLEEVDGNGLLPLAASGRPFSSAHAFRRHMQRTLPYHLSSWPRAQPLAGLELPRLEALPEELSRRWPALLDNIESADLRALASSLPLDHQVRPTATRGGFVEAARRWKLFDLERYATQRQHPDAAATSGLSPYLHFGHISAHQLVWELLEREGWSAERLSSRADGKREGWWGVKGSTESFLDQLVTWRELGYGYCHHHGERVLAFDSLPEWSRATLAKHVADQREHIYNYEELREARTHDVVWNAAQRQLTREGTLHNYLRMLWGKKILKWSPTPQEALRVMIDLNDRLALDGRDPNSYSGIFWVLGRFDRPWGPERPIFGTVRYMTSAQARKKLHLERYLEKFGSNNVEL